MKKSIFYGNAYLYLSLGLVIVFVGFSQSYFGRLGEMALPYHVHGISATIWMLLLVIQPLLYRLGIIKIHRYIGWSSVILVPLIIVGGFIMMKLMIQGQENYPPDTVYMLAFIDALTLIGFGILYFLAIYHRKNLLLHSRFMVSTIFGPLIPALTRVFFILGLAGSFPESLTYSYVLTELVLLMIIWNERKFKEIRFTYVPFLIYMIIQHFLMYYAGGWEWWINLMNNIAGVSG